MGLGFERDFLRLKHMFQRIFHVLVVWRLLHPRWVGLHHIDTRLFPSSCGQGLVQEDEIMKF